MATRSANIQLEFPAETFITPMLFPRLGKPLKALKLIRQQQKIIAEQRQQRWQKLLKIY